MNENVSVSRFSGALPGLAQSECESASRQRSSPASMDRVFADRWRHITRSLRAYGQCGDPTFNEDVRTTLPAREAAAGGSGANARITLLDRLSADKVILSWRDPTACSYGYQVWCRGVSRRAGRCALSGTTIRRGDEVFRPGLRGEKPLNGLAMIRAVHVDALEFDAAER
jgi:hypothetical protein